MSNSTDGRGLTSDEFDDDEIDWDDESSDTDAAPLEEFVGDSDNVFSAEAEEHAEDDEDD